MSASQVNAVYHGGFDDPPVASSHAFRAAMTAMARPGDILDISGATPPEGISVAAGSLILTLCDPETGIYLAPDIDTAELRGWIAFHTGAPVSGAEDADFALGSWAALMPLSQYRTGTSEYPDRSATLIVEVEQFGAANAELRGPGIKETAALALPETDAFQTNATLYPLGLDFFFTAGAQLAALPRSTQVSARG